MIRITCRRPLRSVLRVPGPANFISSSAILASHHPNAPLDIDPSFKALLKDVDISLMQHKTKRHPSHEGGRPDLRELEVYPVADQDVDPPVLEEEDPDHRTTRKSPAAHFGSRGVGAVVIPSELQLAITTLIAESDKRLVHNDAKRLFLEQDGSSSGWDPAYDAYYRSRKQAARHAERDGTAFASVALPAHYSAIYAVLNHIKIRLGPDWNVEKLFDWGAGTGSGLWAAAHVFQKESAKGEVEHARLADSAVGSYLGIDKREGLVSIGKRLLRDAADQETIVSWQKTFQDDDKIPRSEGTDTLALSAFFLSSLSTPLQRKALVKEIWESGAGTIVLIDHSTRAGFESIGEAREHLLRMGKRETEDPTTTESQISGSHVVAPCPHDGACPLYLSDAARLVCGFTQRLQRPPFVRLTKHSGTGHEDIGYSYVVIRRGVRPSMPSVKVGRTGEVGQRELRKQQNKAPLTELELHEDHQSSSPDVSGSFMSPSLESTEVILPEPESQTSEELEKLLRTEAFHWPRLVFTPLKRSGHVILDVCAPEGRIMRMTIPKSQGKQPYYDARKADWGDIFPHEPKNAPQVRYQPVRAHRDAGTTPVKGADIGKRGTRPAVAPKTSYSRLSDEITEQKKQTRKSRRSHKVDAL